MPSVIITPSSSKYFNVSQGPVLKLVSLNFKANFKTSIHLVALHLTSQWIFPSQNQSSCAAEASLMRMPPHISPHVAQPPMVIWCPKVINMSKDVTLPNFMTVDIEDLDVSAVGTNAMDIDTDPNSTNLSSIITDTAYISDGDTAYIDLTILNLNHPSYEPNLMLIWDEWRTMANILNGREKGIWVGAAFAGQMGTGGHCNYSWTCAFNQWTTLFRQDLYVVLHFYPLPYLHPANGVPGYVWRSFPH